MKGMSERNAPKDQAMRSSAIKGITRYLFLGLLAMIGWSCVQDEQSPGVEFMPDMYRSPALEAYMDYQFPDSMVARKPVEGTVPFEAEYMNDTNFNPNFPYPYPDNTSGYEDAGKELKNPIELTPENLGKGEEIYNTFCDHCHGSSGDGDGPVIDNGGHPPPPAFSGQLSELSDGKAFHSITYGKGMMGPHASQLDKEERWLVIHYINVLQNGGEDPFAADEEDGEAEGDEEEAEEGSDEEGEEEEEA